MPNNYMNDIYTDYEHWILSVANDLCGDRQHTKLFDFLQSITFLPSHINDENRAKDGVDFRLRFPEAKSDYTYRDVYLYLTGPCTFLEMLLALSFRCEEHIMGDPSEDDNTHQWFVDMLKSLHLYGTTDSHFNAEYVNGVIDIFNRREYQKNGDGGLFTISNPTLDMRSIEIWWQLNWYLSEKR